MGKNLVMQITVKGNKRLLAAGTGFHTVSAAVHVSEHLRLQA